MNAKTLLAGAALAVAAATPTFAADGSALKPVIGATLTGGGKTLVEVEFDDGGSRKISSGGLTHLFAGLEYREPGAPWSIQATVGYHFDRVSADNGSLSFSRVPLEVLGFWHANDNIRLGGGLRKATGTQFETSGAGNDIAPEFNMRSSLGVVLQGEYLFGEHASVFLRYVNEKYKSNYLVGGEVSGEHGGIGFAYRF
jgi:opacity protein-like surface antigen